MLDDFIKEKVNSILVNVEGISPEEPVKYIETDSLGEVIEKLIILHIRMWMLEDHLATVTTDKEIADIKRKLDVCFKTKRPKYVEAINQMIDNAIK
jgi:hypothetical protein